MTLCFIGALVTSGAVWMIGSDRIQAVASYDGAFFPFFGVFNRKLGTPVRVNVLSGIASSVFAIVAIYCCKNNSTASAFTVVLDIAISTTLLSYLWIFPAVLKLRYSHPHVREAVRASVGHDRDLGLHGRSSPVWILLGLLGRRVPRHARAAIRRRLRVQGHVGRSARVSSRR